MTCSFSMFYLKESEIDAFVTNLCRSCLHSQSVLSTAHVIEMSVTVNDNPIQDYVHPDDHTQLTYEMTPGFKPFTSYNNNDNHYLLFFSLSLRALLRVWCNCKP